MDRITDEQYQELFINGQITRKVFQKLTLEQQGHLYNEDLKLYNKLIEEDPEDMTVDKFLNISLDEETELYNTDREKYIKLQEEKSKVMEGRSNFINDSNKIRLSFISKGMSNIFINYIDHFKNNIEVAKNYYIFKSVVDKLLDKDRAILSKLTKDQLINNIEIEFNSELRYRGIN